MDTLDTKRVQNFFNSITDNYPVKKDINSVVVTHLLLDRPFFLDAINRLAKIVSIIPKPKSINSNVKSWIFHKYHVDQLSRNEIHNVQNLANIISKRTSRPLVLLDIGGYFVNIVNKLSEVYEAGVLGIIEDTENGMLKYESSSINKPVISVARSPLKNPEDYLVGQSIVYSVEALLREQGDILQGRTACVIGYKKSRGQIYNYQFFCNFYY